MEAKSGIESSCESLFFNKDDDYRSPESSDCEGYATPLATSRCDLSANSFGKMISVEVPVDDENIGSTQDSRELTPVNQSEIRAESPPVITQIMFLEKPKILVMTQKQVEDETEVTTTKNLETSPRKDEVLETKNAESSSAVKPEKTIGDNIENGVFDTVAEESEKTDSQDAKEVTSQNVDQIELEKINHTVENTNEANKFITAVPLIEITPSVSNTDQKLETEPTETETGMEMSFTKPENAEQTDINLRSEFEKVDGVVIHTPQAVPSSKSPENGKITNLINTFETLSKTSEVAQAPILPNKIPMIEKYPSSEFQTEENEVDVEIKKQLDSQEEIIAMQKVSAQVEKLVADINAFKQREEEEKEEQQQETEKEGISAFEVVMKKMEIPETKKTSDNELEKCVDVAVAEIVATVAFHDQTIQTDDGDLILVDRWVPEVMETLRIENERLRSQLENLTSDRVEELNKQVVNLQKQLNEANHTIDEIEVEAEQQYTEMTSEIDELCELVMKKDGELAALKENVSKLTVNEFHWKEDVESQKSIVQRQKEVIEGLREDLENQAAKLVEMTRLRDRAAEEATINKMKNQEKESFLAKEAQMSLEIEDLQRELNKQKLILNQTSMAKLADTFERKVLKLENDVRERDMLICKQNQIINRERKSPNGQSSSKKPYQSRAATLAAESGPSAGSSSESFQHGLDSEAKETILGFLLSDRYNQLANIYNIGRILDLNMQEERSLERHLTKDRFT